MMSPAASFFQAFRLWTCSLKLITKPASKSSRKPRPPSPTASIILPDSLVQEEIYPRSEEYTFIVDLDPTLWREILSYCEVIDIIHVGMTCRSLASVTEDYQVWYFALLRICHNRRLSNVRFRIKSFSCTTLRQKAILSARLDRLSHNPHVKSCPYATTRIPLRGVSAVWGMSFLPGGEWLVMLCRFERSNQEQVMLCKTSDSSGRPSACSTMTDGHCSSMRIFTTDQGDMLLLRSDHLNTTKLCMYLIHLSDDCPSLEQVCTVDTPDIENCAASESHLVVGWLNHSDGKLRHFIKVSRFTPCYRGFSEHRTVEVDWDIGKSPHSYGLRIADSQIAVVVSSTELIAAYTVPPLISVSSQCEPIVVMPHWRFSCAHINPRAVCLIPSLPAVDTPSIVIFYGNRYLFLSPSFDADPPDSHPTYFSTFTYSRLLKRPILLGPHRAFWDLGHGRVGTRTLPAPLQPAFYEHGSWHASGINTPEADLAHDAQPLVYAEDYNRKVEKAAWDEESGKLALLPRPDYRQEENMTIFLVEMFKT